MVLRKLLTNFTKIVKNRKGTRKNPNVMTERSWRKLRIVRKLRKIAKVREKPQMGYQRGLDENCEFYEIANFRTFRKIRSFRQTKIISRGLDKTANLTKMISHCLTKTVDFTKFANFRNSRSFWKSIATICKFCNFRSCIQSWTQM